MPGIMGSIWGDNSYAEFYLAPTFRLFEHTPYVTAGYVHCWKTNVRVLVAVTSDLSCVRVLLMR